MTEIPSSASELVNVDTLQNLDIFSGIDSETIQDIINKSHVTSHIKDEYVFMQSNPAEEFYILLKGIVCLYIGSQEGQETLVRIAMEKDVIGRSVLLEDAYYAANAKILEDATLLVIPSDVIKSCLAKNAALSYNLLRLTIDMNYQLKMQIMQTTMLSAAQRLGCFLINLVKQANCQDNSVTVYMPFEKKVIAAYLQMTPETFSRAIAQLKSKEVSFSKSEVHIADIDLLSNYSCKKCAKIYEGTDKKCD